MIITQYKQNPYPNGISVTWQLKTMGHSSTYFEGEHLERMTEQETGRKIVLRWEYL